MQTDRLAVSVVKQNYTMPAPQKIQWTTVNYCTDWPCKKTSTEQTTNCVLITRAKRGSRAYLESVRSNSADPSTKFRDPEPRRRQNTCINPITVLHILKNLLIPCRPVCQCFWFTHVRNVSGVLRPCHFVRWNRCAFFHLKGGAACVRDGQMTLKFVCVSPSTL